MPQGSDDRSTIVRTLAQLWSGEGIAIALGIAQAIAVANVFAVTTYGAAGVVLAIPGVAFVFLDPQTEEAIYRFGGAAWARGDGGEFREIVRLAYFLDGVLATVGLIVVAAIAAPTADWLLGPNGSAGLVIVAAVGAAATAPNASARSQLNVVGASAQLVRVTIIAAFARLVICFSAAKFYGLNGYIVAIAALQLAETAGLMAVARARTRDLPKPVHPLWRPRVGDKTSEVMRYLVYTDLTTLASSLVKHVDVLILSAARPLAEVGGYRIARSIAGGAAAVLRPLQSVSFPRLAAANTVGRAELRRELRMLQRRLAAPLTVLGAVGVGLLPFLMRLVLSPEYDDAIWPAMILAAASLFGILVFWLRPTLLVLGSERVLFLISLTMTIATVVGYLAAAPVGGAVGVALTRATFASFLGNAIAFAVLRKRMTSPHPTVAS